jgi:hypothetical protein
MSEPQLTQIEKFYAACRELGIDGDEHDDAVDNLLRKEAVRRDAASKPRKARKPK